ncbi:shikimate kinase [Dokdonia sinensis]|uniref:Shikimate kinase n=2 Tax=Dokdonia sinensis TaxID=2479847 RepID=A0A3M0GTH8_9FLAO|nr:shikimate kinase [Dokdonia sinensis]
MDIYLIGYMGSGKSTIGRLLADKMDRSFVDFDDFIEENEGMSIPKLFKTKGEIYFRKIEMKYLEELLLEKEGGRVIALGGGTPCYGNNMDRLQRAKVKTIYLNVSYKALARRLWDNNNNRPLVATIDTYEALEDYVRKHLFERSYFYNQAEIILKIGSESEEETINKIISILF